MFYISYSRSQGVGEEKNGTTLTHLLIDVSLRYDRACSDYNKQTYISSKDIYGIIYATFTVGPFRLSVGHPSEHCPLPDERTAIARLYYHLDDASGISHACFMSVSPY